MFAPYFMIGNLSHMLDTFPNLDGQIAASQSLLSPHPEPITKSGDLRLFSFKIWGIWAIFFMQKSLYSSKSYFSGWNFCNKNLLVKKKTICPKWRKPVKNCTKTQTCVNMWWVSIFFKILEKISKICRKGTKNWDRILH